MRSSKKRSRSSQNRPRSLGNIVNRVFDSSGPEGKVRGTPQQIIEKYHGLARDAQLSNDRVAAENFQQHAEHYTRMLAEAQRELALEQEARQSQHGYRENNRENGYRDGAQHSNREHNRDNGHRENGQRDGGSRDQNGRENSRDRSEGRTDYRAERSEGRQEGRSDARRDYRSQDSRPEYADLENDAVGSAEVIELHGDDSGLVELPENVIATPSESPAVAVELVAEPVAADSEERRSSRGNFNRERGGQHNNRHQRGPRAPREERAVEAETVVVAAVEAAPAPVVEAAPAPAPVVEDGAVAKAPRAPSRSRAAAPRRAAPAAAEGEAGAAPRERRPRKPRAEVSTTDVSQD